MKKNSYNIKTLSLISTLILASPILQSFDSDFCNPWPDETLEGQFNEVNTHIDTYPPVYKKTSISEQILSTLGYTPKIQIEITHPAPKHDHLDAWKFFLLAEFINFSTEDSQFYITIDKEHYGPYKLEANTHCAERCLILQDNLKSYKASYSIVKKKDYPIKPFNAGCGKHLFMYANKVYEITINIKEDN